MKRNVCLNLFTFALLFLAVLSPLTSYAKTVTGSNITVKSNYKSESIWWNDLVIDITNNSSSTINGWEIEFDFPFNINNFTNANLNSNNNGHYTVSNVNWGNGKSIEPGETISFNGGFSLNGSPASSENLPSSYIFNGTQIGGNTPPTIAFLSPVNGEVINQNALSPIGISVSANDSDGTVTDVKVEVEGKTLTGSNVNWTPSKFGTFNIKGTAIDDKGGSASTSITVTVKEIKTNVYPVVSFVKPTDKQVIEQEVLSPINIVINATDSDGEIVDSKINAEGKNYDGTNVTFTPSAFGTVTIIASATDDDGVTTETSIQITVTQKENPNVPPTINITSPSNGAVIEQESLSPISITIDPKDSDGTIVSSSITVEGKTSSGTTASWTPSKFGTFTITANAVDNEGASAISSAQITVKEKENSSNVSIDLGSVDNESGLFLVVVGDGETVAVDKAGMNCRQNKDPNDDYYMYFDAARSFVYKGSSPNLFITIQYLDFGTGTLELHYDGKDHRYTRGGSIALTGTNTWKKHEFQINDAYFRNRENKRSDFRIFGGVGNRFYLNQVTVSKQSSPVNNLPTVNITSPTNGAVIEQETLSPISITIDPKDSDGSIVSSSITVEGKTSSGTTASFTPSTFGTVTIIASATDDDGATTETSIQITVTQKENPNVPPTINITSPTNGAVIEQETLSPISITIDSKDSDGTIVSSSITVEGKTSSGTTASWTPSKFGTVTITANAVDNEGASADDSIQITVKQKVIPNIPPTVNITNPSNGAVIEQETLSPISITIDPKDSDGTIVSSSITVEGKTSSGTAVSWTPSKFGTFIITANAVDNEGASVISSTQIIVKEKEIPSGDTAKLYKLFEWNFNNPSWSGNAFDLVATATFTHTQTQEKIKTDIFYTGSNNIWTLRFTGTKIGEWTYFTTSSDSDLNGRAGKITVLANPGVAGFMTEFEHNGIAKWGRQGINEAFVPQYVMYYDTPNTYYNNPSQIDDDIETFFGEHGFNGFHVYMSARWFNMNSERTPTTDSNPDPKTFEALELLIRKTHEAGGVVHIWMWGDMDGGDMSPTSLPGGQNGYVDQRIQRYLCARLGALPGWSMGYGWDLQEWATASELNTWHNYMDDHLGWHHYLGGRSSRPSHPNQISENMDFSSYEQWKPTYDSSLENKNRGYVFGIEEHKPSRPSFWSDRFRIRTSPKPKDYSELETRRGLYYSTMAGGAANIWGYCIENGSRTYYSVPYPNKKWILTYSRVFGAMSAVGNKHRFTKTMERDNSLTDGYCLRDSNNFYVFYKEDTNSISMNLSSMSGSKKAVAINTLNNYEEIPLGIFTANNQVFNAPSNSDWIVVVGDPALNETSIDLGRVDNESGLYRVSNADGDTVVVDQGGRNCRKNDNPGNDYYMYFNVAGSFAYEGSNKNIAVTIDYYDSGNGALELQYDSNGKAYTLGGSVNMTGSNAWKQHIFQVSDAYFGNRQNNGADFRISGGVANTFYIDKITVKNQNGSINTPPTVKITTPSNGAVIEQETLSPISITIDPKDSDGIILSSSITLEGKTFSGTTASFTPSKFGTFTILADATDNEGATSTDSIQISVKKKGEPNIDGVVDPLIDTQTRAGCSEKLVQGGSFEGPGWKSTDNKNQIAITLDQPMMSGVFEVDVTNFDPYNQFLSNKHNILSMYSHASGSDKHNDVVNGEESVWIIRTGGDTGNGGGYDGGFKFLWTSKGGAITREEKRLIHGTHNWDKSTTHTLKVEWEGKNATVYLNNEELAILTCDVPMVKGLQYIFIGMDNTAKNAYKAQPGPIYSNLRIRKGSIGNLTSSENIISPVEESVIEQETSLSISITTEQDDRLGVSYTVDSWSGSYQAVITLTNSNETTTTSSWLGSFTLPTGQILSNMYDAVEISQESTDEGTLVKIKSPDWGGEILPGGTATFGISVQNPNNTNTELLSLTFIGKFRRPPMSGPGFTKSIFAPYVDVMLWPTPSLVEYYEVTEQKYTTLAFIVAGNEGQPAWGGITTIKENDYFYADQINDIRKLGGDVIISFGGANGTTVAQDIEDVDELVKAYKLVIDGYNLTWVDFDIEGAAQMDMPSIERRNKALKIVQNQYPDLRISYCLPILPTGLTEAGILILQDAINKGVNVYSVNAMTMDFGDTAAPPEIPMHEHIINSAKNLAEQLSQLNPYKSEEQIWGMIGVTPMIGINDVQSEIVWQEDAYKVLEFAKNNKMKFLSMWSTTRDHDPGGKEGQVSPNHSGILQGEYEFTHIFKEHSKD
ncbi:MAG TPA: cellulose binding domain-containing protein [Victivallales bacterium]|nr:cellulose binding domain-containing protein [Victivallales bacterium]